MSEKIHNFEADPYIRIEFNLERGPGTHTIHEADCGTRTVISGLKADLSHLFGLEPEHQQWFCNNNQLEDARTLQDYLKDEIIGLTAPKPMINVKRV